MHACICKYAYSNYAFAHTYTNTYIHTFMRITCMNICVHGMLTTKFQTYPYSNISIFKHIHIQTCPPILHVHLFPCTIPCMSVCDHTCDHNGACNRAYDIHMHAITELTIQFFNLRYSNISDSVTFFLFFETSKE